MVSLKFLFLPLQWPELCEWELKPLQTESHTSRGCLSFPLTKVSDMLLILHLRWPECSERGLKTLRVESPAPPQNFFPFQQESKFQVSGSPPAMARTV